MKDSNKALLFVAITVLSWSTVATAFKMALREFTYYELLLVATASALVMFAIVLTVQSKWYLLARLTVKQWLTYAFTGFLNPFFYYLVLFKSYELLPAQIAQPINYFWPILLTVLLAVFMRQHIPAIKYAGMVISFAGVVLISLGPKSVAGENVSFAGILLAFFSAFIWAGFWILNKKNRLTDNTVNLFASFLFGLIYLLIGTLFVEVRFDSSKALTASIYSGLFEMAIPFIFFGLALRKTSNSVLVNQLCYLSPFMSLFFIHFLLGEKIYITTIAGLVLIIAGILFNEYLARKLSPRHSS